MISQFKKMAVLTAASLVIGGVPALASIPSVVAPGIAHAEECHQCDFPPEVHEFENGKEVTGGGDAQGGSKPSTNDNGADKDGGTEDGGGGTA
jgi:hypothetical protein